MNKKQPANNFNLPLTLNGGQPIGKRQGWDFGEDRVIVELDGTVRITQCKHHHKLLSKMSRTITKRQQELSELNYMFTLLRGHLAESERTAGDGVDTDA